MDIVRINTEVQRNFEELLEFAATYNDVEDAVVIISNDQGLHVLQGSASRDYTITDLNFHLDAVKRTIMDLHFGDESAYSE